MKPEKNQTINLIKGMILNNWSLKLAAVFIACITWLVVMYNLNPIDTKTIVVPVALVNSEVLTSENWVFENLSPLEVEVTVEAHSFDLTKIDASDFRLYVDMRYPMGGTNEQKRYKINTELVRKSDLIEKYSLKTDYIDFTLEEIVTREFAVSIITSGTVAENFTPAELPTSVPGSVTVTGRSSEVDKIKKVVYYLDIKNASEEINVTGKPKLLDADDKELTELKSVTMTPEVVQVCQPIYQTKSVVLSCQGVSGTPATGYGLAEILLDTSSIKVAGYKAVLNEFVTLNIPAELIKIDGLTADKTFAIDLEKIQLPDGVKLVGANNVVNVTVKIEKMKQNNFRLTLPDEVSLDGKDDKYDYRFVENVVFVTVEGISNDIDSMESKNIVATVDVSELEVGVHTVALSVKLPEGVKLVTKPKVELEITEHKDEPDIPPTNPVIIPTLPPETEPPTEPSTEPTTPSTEPSTEPSTDVSGTVESSATESEKEPEVTDTTKDSQETETTPKENESESSSEPLPEEPEMIEQES